MELKEYQIELILNLISYAQSDKESFTHFLNMMYGKEYPSIKELANRIEDLRTEIKVQRSMSNFNLREGRW